MLAEVPTPSARTYSAQAFLRPGVYSADGLRHDGCGSPGAGRHGIRNDNMPRAGQIAVQLAAFCRELGYPARAHIDANYQVIAPLVARDAGLGAIWPDGGS